MAVEGWEVRVQRERAGISRAALAEKLGWSGEVLTAIEDGTIQPEGKWHRWVGDALDDLVAEKEN